MKLVLWITLSFGVALVTLAEKPYDGDVLLNLHVQGSQQAEWLENLRNAGIELDFWSDAHSGGSVEVRVPKNAVEYFKQLLDEEEIEYDVVTSNIQQMIDEENKANEKAKEQTARRHGGALSYYADVDEINWYMRSLRWANPSNSDKMQIISIGRSSEGRDLNVFKISSGRGRKAIFINAGQHAREWIAPASVLYMLNELVTKYGSDRKITSLIDRYDWYIMPILNPDGYQYSHTSERMWRKTRSDNRGYRCKGADPNRNWNVKFGGVGTSKYPCSDTYHGSWAFSEPETKAVSDFLTQLYNGQGLVSYYDIHAYSQMWFTPYGFDKYTKPSNIREVERVAHIGAEALRKVNGRRFRVGSAAALLYPSAGGADDWASYQLGVKYAYCLEMRPSGGRNGFMVDPSEIYESGAELTAGLLAAAEAMRS